MNVLKMPPTHLDYIRAFRPFVLEHSAKDARQLLKSGRQGPIRSADEYASSLDAVFNRVMAEVVAQGVGRESAMAMATTVNAEFHAALNWSLSGEKVFLCSDGLVDNLLLTELNVNADQIQVPFDSFALVFQSPEAMDAFHVGDRQPSPHRGTVTVLATMLPPADGTSARRLTMVVAHSDQTRTYRMDVRSLSLPDNWSVEQALQTDWDEILPGQKKDPSQGLKFTTEGGLGATSDETFYTDEKLFYRLILNTILYLSSKDPEITKGQSGLKAELAHLDQIKTPAKRRKATERPGDRQESALDFILVGASVGRLQAGEGEAVAPPEGNPKGWINRRFIVRGHWRNQAFGPGRQDHRVMWIKPFYKGPDLAEMINRPFLVK
jgi:hypothetical protein